TEHLAEMVEMIHRLLAAGYAYEAAGHVLFHVPSFVGYGALSNRRRDEMLAGARVEVAPYKKDAADFVLWKPAAAEEPGWDSPWGRGRPGWHLECSAMAGKHLGECLDIHGGGQDLIFPHHENEIAQSCCASGGGTFARYWLHNGHLTMAGEKMSKSVGNVRLLGDVVRQFPGEAVRYALLSTHYRKPLTWTERLLGDSRSALDRLYRALGDEADGKIMEDEEIDEFFAGALADDINTPLALSRLHDMAGDIQRLGNADTKILRRRLKYAGGLLGFFNQSAEAWFHTAAAAQIAADENSAPLSQQEIEAKIAERQKARAQRDFNLADQVRDELFAAGVVLEDSPSGTGWRRK
ncbi:MAG: cysteine--tRNA ligase, partial [Gammaproteobacteria bacterium]